jgi:TIR domain
MAVSSRIFISYRRDDAPAYAGRLFDQLSERFGEAQVFMDVDTLEPGVDFFDHIEQSIGTAAVLIAVIGKGWANAVDEDGHRRLDNPDDWVRLEVGGALRRDIRVIPVLVGGAQMPEAEELPEDLAELRRRSGLELSDLHWRAGTERLCVAIEHVLGTPDSTLDPVDVAAAALPVTPDEQEATTPAPSLSSAVLPLALAGAGLLTVGIFMRWDQGHSFIQNDFGGNAPNGGAITGLAPIGVVVAALLGALTARTQTARAVGAGILLAAGFSGMVKYLRVLFAGHDSSTGAKLGILAALIGGALVLVAGILALRGTTPVESARHPTPALLGIAGAVVMAAAIGVPFNGGGPAVDEQKVTRSFDESFEVVMPAIAIALVAALLLGRWRHAELSAALLTLGVLAGLVWLRFLVIPLMLDSSVGSFGAGGLIGLVGAGLVVAAGIIGLQRSQAQPQSAAAIPA